MPTAEPTPPVEPIKKTGRWLRFSWALPVLALIIALIVQFSGGMTEKATAAPEVKATVVEDKTTEEKTAEVKTVEAKTVEAKTELAEPQIKLASLKPRLFSRPSHRSFRWIMPL